MNFKSIRSPSSVDQSAGFKPGFLLWVFTLVFLPLFIVLGIWQLNRAVEKEQMQRSRDAIIQPIEAIDWQVPPLYSEVMLTSTGMADPIFLLDNKTYSGQVGYEVFQLHNSENGILAVSLGWVAGSADRRQLPTMVLPTSLQAQKVTVRPAPTNPLFGVDANSQHDADARIWIVQSLSTDWLSQISNKAVVGFVQLNDSEAFGAGPVVWQASVMSPTKHRGYAFQWFGMAIALLGMFIYAGVKGGKASKN